jgi:hypothetical protein
MKTREIKRSGDRRQGVNDIGATNYADADSLAAAYSIGCTTVGFLRHPGPPPPVGGLGAARKQKTRTVVVGGSPNCEYR